MQGTLTEMREWFRDYKIVDGKAPNKFGLGNKPASKVWEYCASYQPSKLNLTNIDMPKLVASLNWTPIFEWYVASRTDSKRTCV